MRDKIFYYLVLRYFILLALGAFNLSLFYFIFTPLTVYPVYSVLALIDSGAQIFDGNLIFTFGRYAEIIPACVAGAAYYLLTILNLSTPMKIDKRLKSLGFLLGGFLLLNVARIFVFILLMINGFRYFDFTHLFTWYFGSTILVVAIWFVNVKLFRIKEIPIYSDVKIILKEIKRKK